MYVAQQVTPVDSWSVSHLGRSGDAGAICASELSRSRDKGAGGVMYQLHGPSTEGCFQPSPSTPDPPHAGRERAQHHGGGSWDLGWHGLKGYGEDPTVTATFSYFIFKMGR